MFRYVNATMVQALRWISTFRLMSGDLTIIVCISKLLRVLLSFFLKSMVLRCWPFGRLVLRGWSGVNGGLWAIFLHFPLENIVIKLKNKNEPKDGFILGSFVAHREKGKSSEMKHSPMFVVYPMNFHWMIDFIFRSWHASIHEPAMRWQKLTMIVHQSRDARWGRPLCPNYRFR